MGESGQKRATVERMAETLKRHESQRGNHITAGEAQKRAAESARTTDAKAEAGALRNKNRRAPKAATDAGRASGKTFVDYGSKKG